MAILFMEGFGQCATGSRPPAELEGLLFNWIGYENLATDPTITAYESGDLGVRKYIEFGTDHTKLISQPFTSSSTVVFGCRVYRYDTSTTGIVKLGSSGAIGVYSDGTLRYTSDPAFNLNHASLSWASTATLSTGAWAYIEVKVVFSATVGEVEFYIDGTLDSSFTGIDTISSAWEECSDITMSYGNVPSSTPGWRYTDIYVTDGDVLGDVEVWYQPADTAGSASNFTPLSGNNEEMVDETTNPDGDTTYNASTSTGTKDQIAHSAIHSLGPAAIQPIACAKADGGGVANVKVGVLSGATESLGNAAGVADSYQVVRGLIYETDPNTSAAWTAAAADAAETVVQHAA